MVRRLLVAAVVFVCLALSLSARARQDLRVAALEKKVADLEAAQVSIKDDLKSDIDP